MNFIYSIPNIYGACRIIFILKILIFQKDFDGTMKKQLKKSPTGGLVVACNDVDKVRKYVCDKCQAFSMPLGHI